MPTTTVKGCDDCQPFIKPRTAKKWLRRRLAEHLLRHRRRSEWGRSVMEIPWTRTDWMSPFEYMREDRQAFAEAVRDDTEERQYRASMFAIARNRCREITASLPSLP